MASERARPRWIPQSAWRRIKPPQQASEVRRVYRFTDRDTGAWTDSMLAIKRGDPPEPVMRFEVEVRPGSDEQFDYVVAPLRRLMLIAIEHESTVIWT